MNRPSEPFNAEERDLAERLARLGGPREPAPALDARILTMARAAVAEPVIATAATATDADAPLDATRIDPGQTDTKITPLKPRPRKPTPRWPLGLSLAASLVLAAGIGWKLHDNGAGIGEGAAETAVAAAPGEDATQVIMVEPPLQREPPPPPPPMESPALADAMVAPASPAAAPAPVAKPERAKEAPPQNAVYAAEAAADAAAPPAAMAAPAPVAQAKQAAEEDSLDRIDVSGSRIRRTDREVGAAEYTRREQEARRRQAVTERAAGVAAPVAAPPPPAPAPPPTASARGNNGFVSGGAATRDVPKTTSDYDDRPPVSADSPEFRQAWLQRIRELLAKGEQAWARESLREFKRRYPDAELPEDLRPLAATLPAP